MPDDKLQNLAQRILRDAGGELTGRVRLQKIAFFLREAGFVAAEDLSFTYYHYGPYSEDLSSGVEAARENKLLQDDIKETDWGTEYSVYTLLADETAPGDEEEAAFVRCAKAFPSVVLELAATALYLFRHEGFEAQPRGSAWLETQRRKKFKAANGRLQEAFKAYEQLRALPVRAKLPEIPFIA